MTTAYVETTSDEVARICAAGAAAAPGWAATHREDRAGLLEVAASALESRGPEIVAAAHAETALGTPRLTGELKRTCFQLRFFAQVLREGSYLEATIDHADDSPMGPRPDLRRMLVPIGPVAVFGASNFPLAFSVPGGDTVSALAAGCPVIVKAHEAHPATSQLCFDVLSEVLPEDVLGLVTGRLAGVDLVRDPHVRAVGFTGSTAGGRALADLAAARPDPIPFYGELGSVNAFVVTPAAAAARATEIGTELAGSFTLGAGQFCTRPGLALVPTGRYGDTLRDALVGAADGRTFTMLTDGIRRSYAEAVGRDEPQGSVTPTIVELPAADLPENAFDEVFGPYVIVVRYAGTAELDAVVRRLPGALTATVHGEDDDDLAVELARTLPARVGRLVWNGYPTGVSVGWAQQHGGPWPGTNTLHTSVGATAIRRFLRPVAWQSAPYAVLPAELRDDYDRIPRRVDGTLRLPSENQR
ncbi:aldehyde dehydrogenase (NADP(+)) [Micromonospora vulcania]|uniref:Aldehyde dehydrogenase (NADP(+)) n=1 Tax=Micromonospora vulcania TaxID=1441873 RepID=A0ABW1H6K0_9ACTN